MSSAVGERARRGSLAQRGWETQAQVSTCSYTAHQDTRVTCFFFATFFAFFATFFLAPMSMDGPAERAMLEAPTIPDVGGTKAWQLGESTETEPRVRAGAHRRETHVRLRYAPDHKKRGEEQAEHVSRVVS